ncbi:hypothetical protein MAR_002050 [Mya arenaria]|uniref:Uncharacterized protein n=1 Tax=Mya arenaria TaxID=6604 RepID=A0ABY7FDL8_MYAAR|nr:hypothetical protein MAR_002050 [Mya arenaria]
MFEAKAAEKRTEMQNILFKLAESATSLSSELEKSHQLVETLKTQRGGNQSSVLMDLGPKKGPNPGKAKPKKVGMSVINPTSKKRKVAHELCSFRNGFHNGDLGVAILGNKVTLTVGKGSTVINLDMFEAKAAEKRTEMQNILFKLAESATSLSSELEKSQQLVETLKTQRGGNQSSALMDLGPKKGPNPGKAKPKKIGMSVINPTSKKRKVAHGVVFD